MIQILGSSEVVKRAVNRLPIRLQGKLKEFSYSVCKRHEEVTIRHLEQWLKDRIMATRDPHFSNADTPKTDKSVSFKDKISNLLTYEKGTEEDEKDTRKTRREKGKTRQEKG